MLAGAAVAKTAKREVRMIVGCMVEVDGSVGRLEIIGEI
jgi:hypothetical protein